MKKRGLIKSAAMIVLVSLFSFTVSASDDISESKDGLKYSEMKKDIFPIEFIEYDKLIGQGISSLGIDKFEDNEKFTQDIGKEAEFYGHVGKVKIQYQADDDIIWNVFPDLQDDGLSEDEIETISRNLVDYFGNDIEEHNICYIFSGSGDFSFQLPKAGCNQICILGWNTSKCLEYFDKKHEKDNPTEIQEFEKEQVPENETENNSPKNDSDKENKSSQIVVTMGMENALKRAIDYIYTMPFSHDGLAEQLKYEGYSEAEAAYGADNCGANWYLQADLKAAQYLDLMAFSRQGLIEQLQYDGFTYNQAVYGVEQNGY